MADILNSISLTGLAATLADGLGIERPAQANPPIESLADMIRSKTRSGGVDRIFMYNPDAIAMWLYQKYTALFNPVVKHTQLALPLQAVMPSVTPVCFGTMYTGAYPEVHGIRKYDRPVIRIDSLFDAAIRAGRKCAIVAKPTCSMGMIYLEREMDYYLCETLDEVNEKAAELIAEDRYDIMCVYNGNYDATMHKNGPEAEISLQQLAHNAATFDRFASLIEEKWTQHDTLLAFAMDHGCHEIDNDCGSHGLDMPEDLNILHFYGICPKK